MTNLKIKKMLDYQEPFAVFNYNEWLKSCPEFTEKSYEIAFVNKEFNIIEYNKMSSLNISIFKENISKFKNVLNESYGSVWEFNNFKNYIDKKRVKHEWS